MKHRPWLILVLVAALAPLTAFAQAKPSGHEPRPNDPLQNMEIKSRELTLEDQNSRLHFEAEMRNLVLAEKRMSLEHAAQVMKGRPPMRPPFACGPGGPRCPMLCPWGFLALCAAIHLLLAWWVSNDIKKRKTGSRIWVVMALLTGLVGTFVYAVVRLGDRPAG